jgi:hypothetical protein
MIDCAEISYVVLGFEVSWNIQLVHADRWYCPTGTLEWIKDPASPVIPAGVLLPRNVSMDFDHSVQNVLDMLFVGQ